MDRIDVAFRRMNRTYFLPENVRELAGLDMPLAIGYGQTNSQPSTVRQMLQWLDPLSGNKVLDVGSGSGWTAALLSVLVGTRGEVYAVEKIRQLVRMGRENCRRARARKVRVYQAGTAYGLPEHAPYDRILVSAAALMLPGSLLDQLSSSGRLVIPVGGTILEISKDAEGDVDIIEHAGYIFVPLV
jgi:protein-L-isoaspartate(D-aspartate) O-methyltransferase